MVTKKISVTIFLRLINLYRIKVIASGNGYRIMVTKKVIFTIFLRSIIHLRIVVTNLQTLG